MLISIQIAFVIGAAYNCFSQDIPKIVRLTNKYLKNGDFKNLTSLYRLPSYFSESKIIEERQGIEDALNLLSNEFGSISDLNVNQEKVKWINLEIIGGDVDFVKSNPNFTQYVFKVNFSKLGNGFIIIRLYENKANPKIRSVGYALTDSPQNRDVIKHIGKKLMNLMFPQPKSKKI